MKLGNNKEFSSKDFIEFARRGPKTAKEKQNIKKGLKKFWDKKGRAVMTVGAGAAALGGITLAAKSGKIPMPGKNRMSQKSQGLIGGAGPQQKMLAPSNSGVNSQPRTIITPPPGGNQSMTVSGSSSQNIVSKVASTTKAAGKQAINRGREFRGAFDQGYAEGPKPGSAEDKIGRGLGKLVKRLKKANKRGYN